MPTKSNAKTRATTKAATPKKKATAGRPRRSGKLVTINGAGMYFRDLNTRIKSEIARGASNFRVENVGGQRYVGTGITSAARIELVGTAGNDLGAFMGGPVITVHGNVQDGTGNTMDSGEIIVHGHAGDIAGFGMRGGRLLVRSDVGYRVGIHMKEYRGKKPVLVVGGTSQDFFGEYMAGGVLVLLGLTLKPGEQHHGDFIGTGMHGGTMYIRGPIKRSHLGKEVGEVSLDEADKKFLLELVGEFCRHFGDDRSWRPGTSGALLTKKSGRLTPEGILGAYSGIIKLVPVSLRPYGRLYAY